MVRFELAMRRASKIARWTFNPGWKVRLRDIAADLLNDISCEYPEFGYVMLVLREMKVV